MKPIKRLSKIQKQMLWIVSKKGRDQLDQFHKINICGKFWREFNNPKILLEFEQLVELGYFDLIGDPKNENYKFSEKGYFESEDYFKYRYFLIASKKKGYGFWVFIWKHFVFTVITAAITAYFIAKYKEKLPDLSFLFFWN